jgi:hypothetical protein
MPEVAEPIVDRRRREHKDRLWTLRVVEKIEHPVVPGWLAIARRASRARVPEVVRFVDDDRIRELGNAAKSLGKLAFAAEVSVAEDGEVTEVGATANVG